MADGRLKSFGGVKVLRRATSLASLARFGRKEIVKPKTTVRVR